MFVSMGPSSSLSPFESSGIGVDGSDSISPQLLRKGGPQRKGFPSQLLSSKVPNWSFNSGVLPEKLLNATQKTSRVYRAESCGGIPPFKLLWQKSKLSICFKFESVAVMDPVRLLCERLSACISPKLPNSDGISPVNLLMQERSIYSRHEIKDITLVLVGVSFRCKLYNFFYTEGWIRCCTSRIKISSSYVCFRYVCQRILPTANI